MNNDDLIKAIQRVGMGTFVKYYEIFCDSNISSEDLIEGFIKLERYSANSATTKTNSARRILKHDLGVKALLIIAESNNTESWVVPKAEFLIKQTNREPLKQI
ncbi:hypothetical protein H5085_14095 [Pseudoalteromonas sp. SR43-6]|uniref:hypothetical protein n=1 Tax=unclassified Pseudoalteromonas TaxID=194690 RepID=UPI0015FA77A8|nr:MULTISPECIES: hypothetical protein [unclassified Pseudoalteromonas]MBB1290326.1 hypothetical protein [Pseudoalteromonas sp. SR41-5]MBB1375427.1 hypothetical protein [Pseudoalteromonas sp. SR43-6]MBB1414675.1 hypothetical protein [Pseudoalteromonas sp. SG43-8]